MLNPPYQAGEFLSTNCSHSALLISDLRLPIAALLLLALSSLPLRIERTFHSSSSAIQYMRIDHRRAYVFVSK